MALSDNRRLYDLSARLAIYVEGVKVQQAKEFHDTLREVAFVLQKLLGRVKARTLDGLTKAQLNNLILELRASQSKLYSQYTENVMKQLQEFMAADIEVNRRVWVKAQIEEDDDSEEEGNRVISNAKAIEWIEENHSNSNLLLPVSAVVAATAGAAWSRAINSPIPANGVYMVPFLKTFANSAQASTENIIRQAWANRMTVEETLALLVGNGTNRQGTSSQLQRIAVQNAAVINTVYAHVSAIASAGVAATVFSRYIWISVLDNKTTAICIGRNGRIYIYGQGPLPPGHINCRSRTAPYNGGTPPDETFYAWMMAQPSAFQEDVLPDEIFKKIKTGKIRATDLSEFEVFQPLTIEQFRQKVRQILSRRYGVTV